MEPVRVLACKQIATNLSMLLEHYQVLIEAREIWTAGSEHARAERLGAQSTARHTWWDQFPLSMRHCHHHLSSLLHQASCSHQLYQDWWLSICATLIPSPRKELTVGPA